MSLKAIPGIVLTVLLMAMLTWAFNIQQADSSEPPATEWNKTYGGADYDGAWSVVETSDGGYALAGYTWSFGADGPDFWLVKVDASGNPQWNKTYGGVYDDGAYFVVETSDGGYALAGYTNSFGAGNYDFWLVKVDSSGNLQWNKTYGGTNIDSSYSVVETSDGGYVLAGYTASLEAGSHDFWLVKVDSSGNLQWNRTYGGADVDNSYSVVETSDGGYALAGYTASFGAGGYDFWLVKVARPDDVADVAVIGVASSGTVVGQGFCLNITVTVQNQGSNDETFNVTAYADQNTTIIGDEITVETQNVSLASGDFTTILFTWNTTGIAEGNYTISAQATPVPGEIDTADNTQINGIVRVIQARFTFSTLYAVNLYVNGTFVDGTSLRVKFHSYSGIYQAETTVWTGTTPTYVFISENVSHPLGLPVEIATLVLTYENGTTISTITIFTMRRSNLMTRLVELDSAWLYASPSKRTAIFLEIIDIDGQWSYAPP